MRLTNDMRGNILSKALSNVPTIDYHALLIPVVQAVICDHMPDHVRRAYDDPAQRSYLKTTSVYIREGNGYNGNATYLLSNGTAHNFHGLPTTNTLEVRLTPEFVDRLKKGTLIHDVTKAIVKSGYFDKHLEQQTLFESVKKRLRSTLRSVGTVKRLYDVLEPELHHLIPKEGDKTANLPALAAPVVDDLRKLGAQLPEVPKAK